MKTILFALTVFFPVFLKAQKMAIGGYVTPTYGNIVMDYSQMDEPAIYTPKYNSIFKIGGGLTVNYNKNRWMLNTGLNFKNTGALRKYSPTTFEPRSYYEFYYSMIIFTVPVGLNYKIINKERFKLYGGISLENGMVINKQIEVRNKQYDIKYHQSLLNSYYLGIMPEIKMESNISKNIFLISNIGLSYQLNHIQKKQHSRPYVPQEDFRINNLFMDIGFGYRLKN